MALRVDDVDLDRDRGLVRRFQEGDGEAFGELYRRYYDRLERFCDRRVPDHHTAEEIAQEAFARALTALPDLGGDRRFYPWVSVIAAHLCVDWHRRQGRWEPSADPDPGSVAGGQDDIVDAVDVTLALAALARLAPRHQDVLQLREIEGWSYRRISEHFGVSIGAVETLLFRARHALRREFHLIEGGGLSAIPVLGWALRHGSGFRRARWLRVPKWVAAARHPTTVVGATAGAAVAAVSFALIPVAIAPPAANSAPVASAPTLAAAQPGHHAPSGTSKATAAGMSASDAAGVTVSASVGAAGTFTSNAVVVAPIAGPMAPNQAPSTNTASSAPAASSGTGKATTSTSLDLTLPAPTVAGVTNALSSLSGTLPAVTGALPAVTGALPAVTGDLPAVSGALPAVTGALPAVSGDLPAVSGAVPDVGSDVNGLTTTADLLLGTVLPQAR
ncbi:MAG: sigma-70 family RNA polymerase sigma factor [Acidimicrobiales bacterium]